MRAALAFLTSLGGSGGAPTSSAVGWFPVVGAVIGGVVGLVWWGAASVMPPLVAAALVVAADLGITGMLHWDGLVDSADGLLAPMTKERRLAAMTDPSVGGFGIGVGAAVILLRWSALSSLHVSIPLIVALWAGSRGMMGMVMGTMPYARDDGGLASTMLEARGVGAMVAGVVGVGVLIGGLALWRLPSGLAVAGVAVVGAGAVVGLARRRIGGFTGDVLGAAGVVMETAGLVAATVTW